MSEACTKHNFEPEDGFDCPHCDAETIAALRAQLEEARRAATCGCGDLFTPVKGHAGICPNCLEAQLAAKDAELQAIEGRNASLREQMELAVADREDYIKKSVRLESELQAAIASGVAVTESQRNTIGILQADLQAAIQRAEEAEAELGLNGTTVNAHLHQTIDALQARVGKLEEALENERERIIDILAGPNEQPFLVIHWNPETLERGECMSMDELRAALASQEGGR